jgi:acyl carrier protein
MEFDSKEGSVAAFSGNSGSTSILENVSSDARSMAEIQAWMVDYLSELLEVNQDEIDINVPFDRYGLDSSAAVGMTGDLEDWLGIEIDPTVIYDYPTVGALSQHLGQV